MESAPEVTDDGVGDSSLPPTLDIVSGWIANETHDAFSIYMKIRALDPPANANATYHYHFHFQVVQSDGETGLYHAMVHHTASGAWTFMVEHWLTGGGTGRWGDANMTDGSVSLARGVIEVRVQKAWVKSPKVDVTKNTWTIDHFYIHADEVDVATGTILQSDTAPSVGTMGSYAVSTGTPVTSSPGSTTLMAIAAVGAAVLVLVLLFRRS